MVVYSRLAVSSQPLRGFYRRIRRQWADLAPLPEVVLLLLPSAQYSN